MGWAALRSISKKSKGRSLRVRTLGGVFNDRVSSGVDWIRSRSMGLENWESSLSPDRSTESEVSHRMIVDKRNDINSHSFHIMPFIGRTYFTVGGPSGNLTPNPGSGIRL